MSGIFGFTYRTEDRDILDQTLGGLEYWNRIYGRDGSDSHLLGHSGLGCHIEHFSDRFPFGGPIHSFDNCEAVIDALLYTRDELEQTLSLPGGCGLSDEELLLKLKERYTIVIVTHNLFQARRIADECIFMLDGEVWEQNTTEELFHNPKRQETKDYLQGVYA